METKIFVTDKAVFEASLSKMNKKLTSYAMPTLEVTYLHEVYAGSNYEYAVIAGEAPHANGWTLTAEAHWRSEKDGLNVVVTRHNDDALPVDFGVSCQQCDHCNVKAYRRTVYAVYNASTGEAKQVGSSCMSEFIGGSFKGLLLHAATRKDLKTKLQGWTEAVPVGTKHASWSTQIATLFAVALIKQDGFVSRAKAKDIYDESGRKYSDTSTATCLFKMLYKNNLLPFTSDDARRASELVGIFKTLAPVDNFTQRIAQVFSKSYVSGSDMPILTAAVAQYTKKKQDEPACDAYIGAVGERMA